MPPCGHAPLAAQWVAAQGTPHTEDDVERLFQEFIPLQLAALPNFLDIIPGVVETVAIMRQRGMKIGATTGYNEEMMALCQAAAAKEGYAPDVSVAVTQVPAGRPAPLDGRQSGHGSPGLALGVIVKMVTRLPISRRPETRACGPLA